MVEFGYQACVAVQSLLAGEGGEAGGLGEVAVVTGHDVQLQIELTEAHQPYHVVEADRCRA
jgi:hypothetical protein